MEENNVLIAHIEEVSGIVRYFNGFLANAEGITYPVYLKPNSMVTIKAGDFVRCGKRTNLELDFAYLEIFDQDSFATEQEWREQEKEHDNPLAKHVTIDINPEVLFQTVREKEDEFDIHAKGFDDYYEDITKEIMEHFNFGNFTSIEDLPFDYVTYEGHYPIERVFKFENEDFKIFDFENDINKHRYQTVFVPKTMAGLDLIDQYIEKIKDRNWLMHVEEEEYLFIELPKTNESVDI